MISDSKEITAQTMRYVYKSPQCTESYNYLQKSKKSSEEESQKALPMVDHEKLRTKMVSEGHDRSFEDNVWKTFQERKN